MRKPRGYVAVQVQETARPYGRRIVRGPEDIVAILPESLATATVEHLVAVHLDARRGVMSAVTVAIGSLDCVSAKPADIYREAVRAGAIEIVLIHNHPTGDPEPSEDDKRFTRTMMRAGELLGITCLDHIVIGQGRRFASLRALGVVA